MKTFTLDRRTLLRGMAGTTLGLPLLDAMFHKQSRAQLLSPPKRYIVVFCGQSIETEDADDDGQGDLFVPDAAGALSAPLKLALKPLEALKSRLSIVSGLSIPVQTGSQIIPGGRVEGGFHYTTTGPLVSGMHNTDALDSQALGKSSDVIVAEALGAQSRFAQLVYRVQAAQYQDFHVDALSWGAPTENGGYITPHPIDPVASPRLAYDTLFSSFTPPGGMEDPAAARALLRRRSVVDRVRRDTEALLPKLGVADRLRMSQHLDAVRTLEARLASISGSGGGSVASCHLPSPPGTDPEANAEGSYSNEEQRAYAFEELIHLALACDLTRVVSYQITSSMSGMTLPAGLAVDQEGTPLRYTDWRGESVEASPSDLHNVSHNYSNKTLAQTISWHTKHLANLLQKLADTPDTTGSLLDHTVVVFLMEAGAGSAAPHTSERMAAIVAGGSSAGIRQGQHIIANGQHPASVLLTAMNAVGVSAGALGEISDQVSELRT